MNRREYLKLSGAALVSFGVSPTPLFSTKSEPEKICFIGDSITFGGGRGYVELMDQYFKKHQLESKPELINCGKNSETISGLTEEDHPGPRPYLFDRLPGLLDKFKPQEAYFCYGINCGIYQPFSKERHEAYLKGLHDILEITGNRGIKTT
ncbi:MAG: G-D-S-L family lipolytic protein, partial [Bacteroidota bacterium]